MSVVASTQAVGWNRLHGVITAGRLTDFFDYSPPFHSVAFCLNGATTVEWKRGTRLTRFQAQPGDTQPRVIARIDPLTQIPA